MSHRWQFYPIVHAVMTVVHLGLSLAFLLAPDIRFSSPSWKPLLDWSNGQVEPWGIAIGICGIMMATSTMWLDMIGEAIAVCWFSFLASAFLIALQDPAASPTGFIVYAGLMAINAALLTQRVIDYAKWRRLNRKSRG